MGIFTTTIAYLVILLLPGSVAIWLVQFPRHRFLLAYAISIGLFTFSQIPFRIGGGTTAQWARLYIAGTLLTWIISLFIRKWHRYFCSENIEPTFALPKRFGSYLPHVSVTICLSVWLIIYSIIGPYTEVPSDFWNHLVRTRWELGRISNDLLAAYAQEWPFSTLLNREYIHSLHAGIWHLSNATPREFAWGSQLASTTIFISAFFWFVYAQLDLAWSESKRAALSSLATMLNVVWMGTGDWAFIRYYASAPVIFTLPLLFLGILLFIDYFRVPRQGAAYTATVLLLVGACQALLHVQETILLAGSAFMISIIAFLQTTKLQASVWPITTHQRIRRTAFTLTAGVVALTSVSLVLFEPHYFHPNVLLNLGSPGSGFFDWSVINPSRQVFQTITLAGILSYFLLALCWKHIKHYPYIIAGYTLPIFVLFNPVFIEVWERHLPTTLLWRFSILVPMALLISVTIGVSLSQSKEKIDKLQMSVLVVVLSLALPISYPQSSWVTNRAPSLLPLQPEQSIDWLADLVEYLNLQDRQLIHTDPVTAYVLRGLTHQMLPGTKFYPDTSGTNFLDIPTEALQKTLASGLVVINYRNGPNSKTVGSLRHWRIDELMVSRFYPRHFVETLENLGFNLIWSTKDIMVFKIK
jgi:hypothetical protein